MRVGAAESATLCRHRGAAAVASLWRSARAQKVALGKRVGFWGGAWPRGPTEAAASRVTFGHAVPRGHVAPRALQECARSRLEGDVPSIERVHHLAWGKRVQDERLRYGLTTALRAENGLCRRA